MLTKQQLLRFVAPDETAAEFFARQVAEAVPTGVACVDRHVRLRPGQVLELVGPTGSGKSELLAQVGAGRGAHGGTREVRHGEGGAAAGRAWRAAWPGATPPLSLRPQIAAHFVTTAHGDDSTAPQGARAARCFPHPSRPAAPFLARRAPACRWRPTLPEPLTPPPARRQRAAHRS
jgi:hypothetical protein